MARKLGLYIHIPFCRSKCDYCDFYSLSGRETRMDDYQKALLVHMGETAPQARSYSVDTVYFGGGTPSFLPGCFVFETDFHCVQLIHTQDHLASAFRVLGL